jgi:DNA-binding beta-propeller fold protein YncE
MKYNAHRNVKGLSIAAVALLFSIILFVGNIAYANTVITFATVSPFPTSLAFDSSGNLYVANQWNGTQAGTISKITPSGSVTLTWATVGYNPNALAFDSSGNLYVANEGDSGDGGGSISKITSGGSVSTFASGLCSPYALVFATSTGNLYVANDDQAEGCDTISKITSGGTLTAAWVTADDDLSALLRQPLCDQCL